MNATFSPATGLPPASVTVAVATDVDVPSAVIDGRLSETATPAAEPIVCVNVLAPETLGETEPSVAVIVNGPGVMLEVTVAW
jgi:hypothetical protein